MGTNELNNNVRRVQD